jgi:hypothetical protein
MRYFPLILVASLFFCLAPAPAVAQQLHCSPCKHAFGEVQVGDSASYSIQLENTGTEVLEITSKSVQGSEFSFGNFALPVKIKPGACIKMPIAFAPTAKGFATGVLTLVSNDPNSPLNIDVRGTGLNPVSPELAVTPATLNFGTVTVGSSASLQATLTASTAAVTISLDRTNSSEFAILGLDLPVTIPAGQSVPVTIQFTPATSGKVEAKAGFISNAADSPTVEELKGTAVAQNSSYVYLSWNPGGDNPAGYNVYRGTVQGGPYQEINTALDASTNYTDNTVACGTTYYYVTTEVNAQGQESGYSNVAEAVVPSQ